MARTKLIDGIRYNLTAEEETIRDAEEQAWNDSAFNRAIKNLRKKRNYLLAETDYLALSDNTMSEAMTNYRKDLRDITNGLTTVEEVEAVEFPTKPS